MQCLSNRIARCCLALLLTTTATPIPLDAADDTDYTIHSTTYEVRLAFAASDPQGHVIRQLQSSDVAVTDNTTIIRHFRSFRQASESPLDIVILLDTSGSLESQIKSEIEQVTNFIADSNWGDRDRVSIVAFGGKQSTVLCARSCNVESAHLKLQELRASGFTPLYDAVVDATEILHASRDPEARPAMILFSDGDDTISQHSLGEAIHAAENLQAAIYCVNARSKKSVSDHGDAVLNVLATNTGGMSYAPGQKIAGVLQAVLEDLHSGYVLTYQLPAEQTTKHSVRILPTRDPKLRFRSRLAYDASER